MDYSEPPPLSENPPREASRNGDVKEVYRQDGKQGAETRARVGGMRFYQKYSESLLLVGKRQKMKDIRD